MQDLPIFPTQWKLLPKSDKGVKAQLKVIKTLIPKAQTIVNCGDPDREGQLLVDEILEFYGNKKPVLRFGFRLKILHLSEKVLGICSQTQNTTE